MTGGKLREQAHWAMRQIRAEASPERVSAWMAKLCEPSAGLTAYDRLLLGASLIATGLAMLFRPGWHRQVMLAAAWKLVDNLLTEADRRAARPAEIVPFPERP